MTVELDVDGNGAIDVNKGGTNSTTPINIATIQQEPSLTIGSPVSIDTLREQINRIWSSGVVDGAELTDNVDGTVDIAEGTAAMRASASGDVDLYSAIIPASTGLSLTDNSVNYIYADYNSGTPVWVVGANLTDFNCQDKCVAYMISREGNNIDVIDTRQQNVDSNRKHRRKDLETEGFRHVVGGSAISSTGLTVQLTSGAFYFGLTKILHAAFDTSGADTFDYYYTSDSGATWTKTASQTAIDNTYYNDITSGKVALSNSQKYKCDFHFLINNDPSRLVVVYGQQEYDSLAEAEAARIPSILPPVVSGLGVLVGTHIVKSAAISMQTETTLDTILLSTPATTHNGLAGIQGGLTEEYYHLSADELASLSREYASMYFNANATAMVIETSDTPIGVRQLSAGTLSDWTFSSGSTAPITAYADYSGTVAGAVLATSTHGLTTGDFITIRGTTNYNGIFQVVVVDSTHFYFIASWVANDGASDFDQPSYIQAGADSAGVYNIEWSISTSEGGAAGSTVIFKPYVNATAISEAINRRKFSNNDVGAISGGGALSVSVGDRVYMTIVSSGVNNITNSYGSIRLHRL